MLRRGLIVLSLALLAFVVGQNALAEGPHFYSPPYVLGPNPPAVGSKLSGENGGVFCEPGCFKQEIQWFHCTANSNVTSCVPVTELRPLLDNDKYYTVQEGDIGWSIVAQVTAWNHDCNEYNTECRDSHTTRNSVPTAAVVGSTGGAGGGGAGGGGGAPPPPSPIVISPSKLFPATPAIYYDVEVTASGGSAPYTCALTGGMLPFGLTLSGCSLSGLPQAMPGVFTFTVTVTDKNKVQAVKTFAMIVATPVIVATPLGVPTAFVGQAYTQQLGATGGNAPYTFLVLDGTLPAGITLSTSGLISGTPTAAGTSLFTVTMKDALAIPGTQTYRLVVETPSTPIVKKPGVTPKKKVAPKKKTSKRR